MTPDISCPEVWIVQFSKNRIDDIADSSIHGVYQTEEQAREVCKRENEWSNIRGYDRFHYYYDRYFIHEIPKSKDENVVMKCGDCPMCKVKIDGLEKILPCPCGKIFCTNCHFELKHSDIWMVEA